MENLEREKELYLTIVNAADELGWDVAILDSKTEPIAGLVIGTTFFIELIFKDKV